MSVLLSLLALTVNVSSCSMDHDAMCEDPDGAILYLLESLLADEAYEEPGFLETVVFTIENPDENPENEAREYFDIAMREYDVPDSVVDLRTLEVLDRFRVYTSGRILYWSTIPGMYIPYEDFLAGRTDL